MYFRKIWKLFRYPEFRSRYPELRAALDIMHTLKCAPFDFLTMYFFIFFLLNAEFFPPGGMTPV